MDTLYNFWYLDIEEIESLYSQCDDNVTSIIRNIENDKSFAAKAGCEGQVS